jgi:hypothetical protein
MFTIPIQHKFPRFDKTWEEFIDINCNEELQDCDKLKIQILPGTH